MLRCERGHSFDIARDGYVNLCPAPRRVPKFAGDDREMLQSRRRFLDAGFYEPLSDAVNLLVAAQLQTAAPTLGDPRPPAFLDAGCGEGYYLGRLRAHLAGSRGPELVCLGTDIAKPAVAMAARRYRMICFVCASTAKRLPIADASLAGVLNIFAPRNRDEFARVTASGGLLLVVIPTPEHLAELRTRLPLLSIEERKQEHLIAQLSGPFELARGARLSYEISLAPEHLLDLIRMTPSARHLSTEDWPRVAALAPIRTHVAFELLSFRRTP